MVVRARRTMSEKVFSGARHSFAKHLNLGSVTLTYLDIAERRV